MLCARRRNISYWPWNGEVRACMLLSISIALQVYIRVFSASGELLTEAGAFQGFNRYVQWVKCMYYIGVEERSRLIHAIESYESVVGSRMPLV